MTMVCISTGCCQQILQGGDGGGLALPHGPGDDAHGGAGVFMAQEQVSHRAQLPVPFLALGVIEHDDEIALGRQLQALLNRLPGGEEVAQGDDDKIVHQGRPQEGRARGQGRDAGDHLQVEIHVGRCPRAARP